MKHDKRTFHGSTKPRRTVRVATTVRIEPNTLQSPTDEAMPQGLAIAMEITPEVLARARRQGGFLQNCGIVTDGNVKLGLLAMLANNTGELVVIPFGVPEVATLLAVAKDSGTMLVVATDKLGDGCVVVLNARDMDTLFEFQEGNSGVPPWDVMAALVKCAAYMGSDTGTSSLPVPFLGLNFVTVHALVSESLRDAVVEPTAAPEATLH